MNSLQFSNVRSAWLALFACMAVAIIIFAVAIRHYFVHPTDVVVTTVIPGICCVVALLALSARYFARNQVTTSVAVEILWTGCISPLAMILVIYSYSLSLGTKQPIMSWPLTSLRALSWILASMITLYTIGLMLLGTITAITIDRQVWLRPIAGSPSPFPLVLIGHILYARAFRTPRLDGEGRGLCPPGCTCNEKLPPSALQHVLPSEDENIGQQESHGEGAVPGIRVPTILERHSVYFIGFAVVDDIGTAETNIPS